MQQRFYFKAERFSGNQIYLISISAICLVILVLAPFQSRLNSTTTALILLLVILIIASFFGSRPAFLASIIGVLGFNFFFLPPLRTFNIADPQNWVALAAFLFTGLVAGQLSSYARRQAAEAERRRIEIERLYEELKVAFAQASQVEALRQSEQLKSSLLDAVTHDLRSPLTSIKTSVSTLKKDSTITGTKADDAIKLDSEQRQEFLAIIEEETDRLNNFVGEMVHLARIEAGNLKLRKSWTELRNIVEAAANRLGNNSPNQRLQFFIERDFPLLKVDVSSIEEIIYNLLDNAIKYSPENSEIRVSAKRKDDETVEISVEDKGKGIDKEVHPFIFDKFYRESSGGVSSNSSGMGLGLSIAKGITESQGGKIWVSDGDDGFKTKFVFTLPIGDDEN